MKSKLLSFMGVALFSIFILLIEPDPDINEILKIVLICVITIIDCVYIYKTNHIDLETRPEKTKSVKIIGIVLIIISGLFAVLEGINYIEGYRKLSRYWEFLLSVWLIIQVYKTMRGFSNSLTVKNKTEWFYENEEKQEEK